MSRVMSGLLRFIVISIVTINAVDLGILGLARPELKSPFTRYERLFGADPQDAASMLGSDCKLTGTSLPSTANCDIRPTSGPFSHIEMTIVSAQAYEATFWINDRALELGNLILLWGVPAIKTCNESAMLSWPTKRITALVAVPGGKQIDDFMLVNLVTFRANRVPAWEKLWMTDYLLDGCERQQTHHALHGRSI